MWGNEIDGRYPPECILPRTVLRSNSSSAFGGACQRVRSVVAPDLTPVHTSFHG